MTHVAAHVRGSRRIASEPGPVWALVSDVPTLARLLPRVGSVEELGDGRWRWTMEPVRGAGYDVRPVFTTRVELIPRSRVELHHDDAPAEADPGASTTSGHVTLAADDGGTRVSLQLQLSLVLDVPRLLAPVVRGLLRNNLEQLVEGFLTELDRTVTDPRPNP